MTTMEPADDEKVLADIAALVCAIDADDVEASSRADALLPGDDVGASLLVSCADEDETWFVFDDIFCHEPTTDATTLKPADTNSPDCIPSDRAASNAATSSARSKASRDRQKAELVYLKDRVSELEQQLHDLREGKRVIVEQTQADDSTQCSTLSCDVKQFWKRQAEGERKARERSIADNARLRLELERQLRLAKSLARLLRKRPSTSHSLHEDDMNMKRNRLQDAGESEIYEFLLRDMDVRYTQVDVVLRESGLSSRQTTYEDARFVEPKRNGSHVTPWYLEFVDSSIVPFEYALVRDVTWRSLSTPTVPLDNGVYEVIETSSDVIKAEFRIQMHVGTTDVLGRARFVTRRYIEGNRLVLVWALWSTTEGGLLYDQQIRLIEEGWGVVCPHASPEGDQEQSYSLVQRCGRMRPNMVIRKSTKLEEHVGLLTDMLLRTYHDILRGLNDHMGRMMIEAAGMQ